MRAAWVASVLAVVAVGGLGACRGGASPESLFPGDAPARPPSLEGFVFGAPFDALARQRACFVDAVKGICEVGARLDLYPDNRGALARARYTVTTATLAAELELRWGAPATRTSSELFPTRACWIAEADALWLCAQAVPPTPERMNAGATLDVSPFRTLPALVDAAARLPELPALGATIEVKPRDESIVMLPYAGPKCLGDAGQALTTLVGKRVDQFQMILPACVTPSPTETAALTQARGLLPGGREVHILPASEAPPRRGSDDGRWFYAREDGDRFVRLVFRGTEFLWLEAGALVDPAFTLAVVATPAARVESDWPGFGLARARDPHGWIGSTPLGAHAALFLQPADPRVALEPAAVPLYLAAAEAQWGPPELDTRVDDDGAATLEHRFGRPRDGVVVALGARAVLTRYDR